MAKAVSVIGSDFSGVISRAGAGESFAFERLYRAYSGRVMAFARARGSADPEAIANDVMLKVFQNLASFSGDEAAFVSWIFVMARNLIIDRHRMSTRRPDVADGVDVPDLASNAPGTEDVALVQIGTKDMALLLGTLTPDQAEVIALRMVADLSIQDVSEIIGKPVSAIKALQRRGLRSLQKEILAGVVSQ